jgi:selenocysteine lyase/cysteine desulfurase
MIDKIQYRNHTPYIDDHLFFNNAGSSIPTVRTLEAIKDYLDLEAKHGGYEIMMSDPRISETYKSLATLLNCKVENLAMAESATLAFNNALSSIPFAKGDHVLTLYTDYTSNFILYNFLRERHGVKIIICDNNQDGDVDLEDLELKINNHHVKLVSVSHIPTNSGITHDVVAIGKICRKYGVYYAVDACQSVGQMPVDVQTINCDILAFTARKFVRGPRGIGSTYLSDRFLNLNFKPIMMDGNGASWTDTYEFTPSHTAKRYEPFERSYAGVVGLGEALKYINELGINKIFNLNKEISEYAREQFKAVYGIKMMDRGNVKCNIITMYSDLWQIDALKNHLTKNGVKYSISPKYGSFIDMNAKGVDWVLRLSPHYFNTHD